MAKSKAKSKEKAVDEITEVNWVVLLVMSILFGWLGVDRFIMKKIGTGLLKLFTLGGIGIWWLVDIILVSTKYKFKKVKYI